MSTIEQESDTNPPLDLCFSTARTPVVATAPETDSVLFPHVLPGPIPTAMKNDVVTFKMYWSMKHCSRKFLLEQMKVKGHKPREKRLGELIGKVIERLLHAYRTGDYTKDLALDIVHESVSPLNPEDQRYALGRIMRLVQRAFELEGREKQTATANGELEAGVEISPQFYVNVSVKIGEEMRTFRLPAQPDRTRREGVRANGRAKKISIFDDKTGGRLKPHTLAHMDWHGMIVSVDEQEKSKESASASGSEPRRFRRRKGRHHTSLFRQAKLTDLPKIELVVSLLGMRKVGPDRYENVEQPKPIKYDPRLEESRLNDVKHVIKKIASAFETGEFPAEACSECKECPFAMNCPGFALRQQTHPAEFSRVRPRSHERKPYRARPTQRWTASAPEQVAA